MNRHAWRQLDPRDLPDWPLAPQACALLAALATASALATALLWRNDLGAWRALQQQQSRLIQQIDRQRLINRQGASLAQWLPRRGLGCPWQDIRTLASELQLSLLMGDEETETRHGALTEASIPLQLNADYPKLVAFIGALAQADTAWRLEPLTVQQGSGQRLELQAEAHCIRHAAQPEHS